MTDGKLGDVPLQKGGAGGDGWCGGLQMPPRQTVSEWADAHRMIAQGTGPEPGRWRTDRTPYLREFMDSMADPAVDTVVGKMSSQVGKTEGIFNGIAYYIAHEPAPQMLVMPNLELAESFSTKRFTPTVEASPALSDRLGRLASRDSSNTILEKAYPGGDVVFAGANSSASLASRPRRVVFFDEVDKYRESIGNDGDPISQGIQRTQNFWNRKHVVASTPTVEGLSAIDDWFARSDQRHFEIPCDACGAYRSLEWADESNPELLNVVWEWGRPETAHYKCQCCGELLDQRQISLAVRHGHWVPRAPFNGIRGYYCWAIYSPWVTMAQLAAEWEKAKGRPAYEQTFVNLKLGRSYNPTKAAQTTAEQLLARKGSYGPSADGSYLLPDGVLFISAHVDVQRDRWECQYIGWGFDDEKWSLDMVRHYADTGVPQNWSAMEAAFFSRVFRHPSGRDFRVESVAIDAGYQQQLVLNFVRDARAAFKPFYAVRGMAGEGRPIIRESREKFKQGAVLHLVGVDDGKTHLYNELAAQPDPEVPGSGYRVHFPQHYELSYFEQLIAEKVKVEFVNGRPRRKWVNPSGKRNEALDTFVGAMAARYAMVIDFEQRRAQLAGKVEKVSFSAIAGMFKR